MKDENVNLPPELPKKTLRDLFAGEALNAMIANSDVLFDNVCEETAPTDAEVADRFAKRAYQFADAMLKAREK